MRRAAPTTARRFTQLFHRSSIAGIYIHATAVNNLIGRNAVTELGKLPIFLIAAGFAALAAVAARLLRPMAAALTFLAMTAIGVVDATVGVPQWSGASAREPFIAGLGALVATIGYRFVATDKDRRLLQKSFALYLAPHVINRMLASNKLPELGGETRNITAFFSDIEGFSLIAEEMSPDGLVALMNAYLSAMTDVIESHGGYVDKYIGDSIVAVFGAPADDPDHAANAARAALAAARGSPNSTATAAPLPTSS